MTDGKSDDPTKDSPHHSVVWRDRTPVNRAPNSIKFKGDLKLAEDNYMEKPKERQTSIK